MPKIAELIGKVGNKYSLVVVSAKRARQITDYYAAVKRGEFPATRAPQVETMRAAKEKALTVAFQEIAEDKLVFYAPGEAPEAETPEAIAALAAADVLSRVGSSDGDNPEPESAGEK